MKAPHTPATAAPAGTPTPAYDVTDPRTCDTEPAHLRGSIQPHGVLLALDADLVVVMTSANVGTMLGVEASQVMGLGIAEVVGAGLADRVVRCVAEDFPNDPMVVVLDRVRGGALAGREVDVRVHASGSRVVVEMEELARSEGTTVSYRSARGAMARLAQMSSVEELADLATREVRDLTGFDRVMAHRFDASWNGQVVAEAKRSDLTSLFGLHYLATDVPAQARRLDTLNPIQLIADVGYTPVLLTPSFDPGSHEPLDLSFASLRSVVPTNLAYLANMKVSASMSISIVIDDELWGVISCHHYSGPHRPSQDARSASEFVAQVAGHLIAHRERADARDAAVDTQAGLTALTGRLSASEGDVLDALFADPAILGLLGATGAAQFFDGVLRTAGVVPPVHLLQGISDTLNEPDRYLTSTSHLAELDPELAELADVASGVLRVGTLDDRWGLWFRPEHRQSVDGGGDPANERLAEGAEVRASPRKSFERWQQVMRGHSAQWAPWHLQVAEELGQHINSLLLLRSREQVAMAESMQRHVVLDRAPDFDGAELVARYRPASTYQLGGDWWDAFELPDRRLAFVVGDVAGHGVAAASTMTQVRTALRAYLYEGHSPAQCLDRLDLLMDGLLGLGVATAIVAVLDVTTGQFEIANAGHPAPMHVHAAGGADVIDMEVRPLLGVGTGTAPTHFLDLPVGDTLVLFTDGLVERRGVDMDEGTARLAHLAGDRGADEGVEVWADRLLAERDTADDDTTLLAIRRT